MSKMSPYEALMQTQSLTKRELPIDVQTLIKRIEATRNTVLLNKKTDENGNPIVSDTVKNKIKQLDSEIVNKIWDFLDERQKVEIRKRVSQTQVNKEKEPEQPIVEQPEIKKEGSNGKIGFFNW
jgi:hypothetical protein